MKFSGIVLAQVNLAVLLIIRQSLMCHAPTIRRYTDSYRKGRRALCRQHGVLFDTA